MFGLGGATLVSPNTGTGAGSVIARSAQPVTETDGVTDGETDGVADGETDGVTDGVTAGETDSGRR